MIFSVVSVIFPSCTYLSDHRTFPFISTLTGKLLILLYLIVMTSSKNPVSFGVILIPTRRISPGFVGRLSYVAAVQPQVVLASTIPCIFNLYGCFFYFRFVESTKVNF